MKTTLTILAQIMCFASAQAQVYTGVATDFEALGSPYGGCGVPAELVDSDHFVALNVFNRPNTGAQDYTRPLKENDTVLMGQFANGMNCGRWVKVTIGADCIDGINDGALNQEFCRGTNAKWVDDQYSGAELYMVVTDACGDNNGWCRNSQFHLDLHTSSLNQFEKEGIPVGDMYPLHFNNRKITWEYTKAPRYKGDIKIYFMQGAEQYWPAIMITNLENGITAMEQKINGVWQPVERNSDMGQAFILKPATEFSIRIKDITGKYINYGKEYTFDFPDQCKTKCTGAATLQTEVKTVTPPVTQTIALNKGWNLISIQVHPADSSIARIFAGLDVVSVKTADGFWNKGQPDHLQSLTQIEAGAGYLLYMDIAGTLSVTGIPIDSHDTPAAQPGWNIIGSSFMGNTSFSELFNIANCQVIKDFDGFWTPSGAGNIHSLQPGKGYFVKY